MGGDFSGELSLAFKETRSLHFWVRFTASCFLALSNAFFLLKFFWPAFLLGSEVVTPDLAFCLARYILCFSVNFLVIWVLSEAFDIIWWQLFLFLRLSFSWYVSCLSGSLRILARYLHIFPHFFWCLIAWEVSSIRPAISTHACLGCKKEWCYKISCQYMYIHIFIFLFSAHHDQTLSKTCCYHPPPPGTRHHPTIATPTTLRHSSLSAVY